MENSLYYFAKVSSEKMNEFENLLNNRDIGYIFVSHFFTATGIEMIYGIDTDEEFFSFLKLLYPHNEIYFYKQNI